MSYLNKNNYSKASQYNVIYSDMRGVDFSDCGSGISRNRFAYLENMYRDYEGDGAGIIESIPGYRLVYDLKKSINGLYSYKNSKGYDMVVAHAEDELHEFYLRDADTVLETICTEGVENTKSRAFAAKDSLFVLDGKRIFKLSSEYRGAIDEDSEQIYVPTTYLNGEEYEQRNLLTRKFKERYNIGSSDSLSFGTPSLKYAISDEEGLRCRVTGIDNEAETLLYIPSRVKIGDKYYSVTEIDSKAFKDNKSITECFIASGVITIGYHAFYNCTSLTRVILSDTVTELGNSCFSGCTSLSELHLGLALRRLGGSVIGLCSALTSISYAGSESDFDAIENTSVLGSTEIVYEVQNREITVGIEINSPCLSVESVLIDGEQTEFNTVYEEHLCKFVTVRFDDKSYATGSVAVINGTLSSAVSDYVGIHRGFLSSAYKESEGEVSSAILGCTIAESFDGRIFLTGNDKYPGYTFYSSFDTTGENNPLYFGELNYFKDGVGNFSNVALLAAGDSLAIFKERDDGGGSIYYRTGMDTDSDIVPRIYPVAYAHSGFCAKGDAISFFDDPVFISEKGLSALAKKTINLERSIATRSSNINPKLLSENLSEIKLAVWRGYLVLLSGEHIYLADSRSTFTSEMGDVEYEWYYLAGIGSRRGGTRVYKYSATAHTGYSVHENADCTAPGTVYGAYVDEEAVYFVTEESEKYEVYPTEELVGGDFYPASHILAVGDLLLFGTEAGEIYIFNNDKRGAAPPYISQSPGFDKEEYAAIYERRIHPYYYSFAAHAPRYAMQTKKDDCGIPHLEKNTVKDSLALKCRVISGGSIVCEVGTDNSGFSEICSFPNREVFFGDVDFSSITLSTSDVYTVPVREKSKGWVEKQLTLYTNEYGSPFGVYMIAYRFTVKGKIKKNR